MHALNLRAIHEYAWIYIAVLKKPPISINSQFQLNENCWQEVWWLSGYHCCLLPPGLRVPISPHFVCSSCLFFSALCLVSFYRAKTCSEANWCLRTVPSICALQWNSPMSRCSSLQEGVVSISKCNTCNRTGAPIFQLAENAINIPYLFTWHIGQAMTIIIRYLQWNVWITFIHIA